MSTSKARKRRSKPFCVGFVNGKPGRKYFSARVTLDGLDYDAKIPLINIRKQHIHLLQDRAPISVAKNGTVSIRRLPCFTAKDAMRIARYIEMFDSIR